MECNARPPAPGCQSPATRSFHRASFSDHVSPLSRLSNSDAGAAPAYSTPSSTPGLTTQMRSTEVSDPSGNAGPAAWVHSPVGSSVNITRGP